MATFADVILSRGESPSLYEADFEDKTLKSDTDGGYEFRRDRTTRAPRRMFVTGFLSLPHADFEKLEAFYLTHTNVVPFIWRDYIRGADRNVRFDEFKPTYVGVGTNRMWNVKIKMSQI